MFCPHEHRKQVIGIASPLFHSSIGSLDAFLSSLEQPSSNPSGLCISVTIDRNIIIYTQDICCKAPASFNEGHRRTSALLLLLREHLDNKDLVVDIDRALEEGRITGSPRTAPMPDKNQMLTQLSTEIAPFYHCLCDIDSNILLNIALDTLIPTTGILGIGQLSPLGIKLLNDTVDYNFRDLHGNTVFNKNWFALYAIELQILKLRMNRAMPPEDRLDEFFRWLYCVRFQVMSVLPSIAIFAIDSLANSCEPTNAIISARNSAWDRYIMGQHLWYLFTRSNTSCFVSNDSRRMKVLSWFLDTRHHPEPEKEWITRKYKSKKAQTVWNKWCELTLKPPDLTPDSIDLQDAVRLMEKDLST